MASCKALPKYLLYRENGTGRDSYIAVDNGGMYHPSKTIPEYPVSTFIARRKPNSVKPQMSQKVNRYNSNGTGRDSYIMSNSGGFEMAKSHSRNLRFEANLRMYNPNFRGAWMPYKERLRMHKVYQSQQVLNKRLSQPRVRPE